MNILERVKLILQETLDSPFADSYLVTIGGRTVVLKRAGSYPGIDLLAFFGSDAANESNVPHLQALLSATCDFGFKAGFGGRLGLLGGKTS